MVFIAQWTMALLEGRFWGAAPHFHVSTLSSLDVKVTVQYRVLHPICSIPKVSNRSYESKLGLGNYQSIYGLWAEPFAIDSRTKGEVIDG
jgi:hypothetical protein